MFKRTMDIVLALAGVLVSLPFLPLIAVLIKLDSRGPVFYRCDRVGKDMKSFKMYKFRTMLETAARVGESVSPQMDPRVTRFGRFLRRTKINEIPQFINILKGEMCFVGPRPEAPDLAELYPEHAKRVFSVKPGLLGPNQVTSKVRNEEELYPAGVDAAKFYIEEIMPPKVTVDLEYIDNPTLFKDIKYIFLGVKETLAGAFTRGHIRKNLPQILLFLADGMMSIISYLVAETICAGSVSTGVHSGGLGTFVPALFVIRGALFYWAGMYDSLIRFIDYQEIFRVAKAVSAGSVVFASFSLISGMPLYGGLTAVLDWCFLVLLLSYSRFCLKRATDRGLTKLEVQGGKRVLIFGAGTIGELASRALHTDKKRPAQIVGFLDDDPQKHGKRLNGARVMGNRHHLEALAHIHDVSEIILAVSWVVSEQTSEIASICRKAGLKCRIFSPMMEFEEKSRCGASIRPPELEELLSDAENPNRIFSENNRACGSC